MGTANLLAFGGSYFLIAVSPGLCMTLSMSLGISIGLRRTIPMMIGELAGIGLVATASMVGVSAMLLGSPRIFEAFKILGATYLIWMAWRAWKASTIQMAPALAAPAISLCAQGFATAVFNPKAWAFNMALLPPFLDSDSALGPQIAALVSVMLLVEFTCLMIYAKGGSTLNGLLIRRGKAQWLNRAASAMMVIVAAWLLLG